MSFRTRALLATAAMALATSAQAAEPMASAGDLVVRARGIAVIPDESATITPIGGDVGIDTAVMPELDFSYFVTDTVAFELIAAVSPHDVRAIGTSIGDADVGDLLLLPPTLTVQYHMPLSDDLKPYVGAGINATFFIDEDAAGGVVTDVNAKDTLGWALQAGVDYRLSGRWMFNVDVKRLFLDTKVKLNGGAIDAKVNIDPWIVGVGFGYRF
ncbi:MAG: OmpW family protein [Alphaproteobacteria bacterium]|nr:MAG: OmpW family protein [Alphaproteobacteria bacterium]